MMRAKRIMGTVLIFTILVMSNGCVKKGVDVDSMFDSENTMRASDKEGTSIKFNSSNERLDMFVNEYLERHLRDGQNRIHDLPLGASVMFNKEWETMSLMWFDSTYRTVAQDRHNMVKGWIEDVPVDKYGYVWSTKYSRQPSKDGPLTHFSQGWPFPDYAQSQGKSRGWEFNANSAQGWTSNGEMSTANGYLSVKYAGHMCEIESPQIKVDSFHAPFLEVDINITDTAYAAKKELDVEALTEINLSPEGNQYIFINFNKRISDKFMPHANASEGWIRSVGSHFGYDEDDYKLLNNYVRNSVREYIKINGKKVGEILDSYANDPGMREVAVMTHFNFEPARMDLYLSANSNFLFDLNGENTIEILEGFKTPSGDTIKASQKWIYSAASKKWSLAADGDTSQKTDSDLQSASKEIYVYWKTEKENEYTGDKSFRQSVDSTIPISTITANWGRHIFFPAFLHEKWKDNTITGLKIVIKGAEEMDLKADLNFVRMNYDTRHSNNNSLLLTSAKNYYEWTGDDTYLINNITRLRKAMQFFLTHLQAKEKGLMDQSYFTGHDGVRKLGHGIGNGYWDILSLPPVDMYSNIYFYRALKAMETLERVAVEKEIIVEKPTVVGPDGKSTVQYDETAESLGKLAERVKAEFRKTFWNEKKGRFLAGTNTNGEVVDYGFIMFNLEAVASGLASPKQEKEIMDWISGKRIIAGETSTGEDIYKFEFAPRSTTVKNNKHYFWGWDGSVVKFGDQVQDGGAIMYVSYYDLMSRIRVYGQDNAFERLKGIQGWYEEVKAAGGQGQRFYREYYEKKGIQMQGGGTAGGVGLDFEFLESALLYSSIPFGFFGLKSEKPGVLQIEPNLPKELEFWQIENIMYNNVLLDIKIGHDYVEVANVRGDIKSLRLEITLPKAGMFTTVERDGKKISNWVKKAGKAIINVPLDNGTYKIETR